MTRRCWCGRTVSWDGVFCAEHDDGPAETPCDVDADARARADYRIPETFDDYDLAACAERHPSGRELPQTADVFDYLRQKGEIPE